MLPYIHILGFFWGQNAAIYTHFWNLIFSEKTKKNKNNNDDIFEIIEDDCTGLMGLGNPQEAV